ncbi:AI-2E family transporter [Synechococcus sp. RSCCF101]|uniref:AI-2E family transporter n=1 Tax=Synechococcus sp. RSCCF101 TaxID=2511069 RepID=UPI001248086D|nr:AI-2E family transporter [Synechococcus sp. RSCCF101]QEY31053.1 AI-2E family transporter [Synechococcus sp. RSCCF101]
MTLPLRPLVTQPRWLRNALLLPLWFLNAWLLLRLMAYLQPFLTIFILAVVVAILVDLPVRRLQRIGLGRGLSLLVVVVAAVLLLTGGAVVLSPLLAGQVRSLMAALPTWVDSAQGLAAWVQSLAALHGGSGAGASLMESLQAQVANLAGSVVGVLPDLFSASVSAGLFLFLTLILTVFLLVGGPSAWDGLMRWLPPWWRQRIGRELPVRIRTFLRGQVILAFGFSVVLALVFTLVGVPYGALFGFLIGMASMLPFMGAIAQVSVSGFLMVNNLSVGITVFVIAFVLGQILDNVIVPRVMGSMVGLNPLWLLFTLFLGAKVAGLPGILLAIPVASTVNVIAEDWMADQIEAASESQETGAEVNEERGGSERSSTGAA